MDTNALSPPCPRIPLSLAAIVLFFSTATAQNSPVQGKVADETGDPIAGALVYGSVIKKCCPFRSESTKTDATGAFHLEHPGVVIHVLADKFEPQAFVVHEAVADIQITLARSGKELTVPVCGAAKAGYRRIGWGKLGPQFDVPIADVKIQLGRVDVDYVRHVVSANDGSSRLEFWLGPMAMSPEPDDDLFIKSVKFSQREIVTADGKELGLDSRGELNNGKRWRRTAIVGEGGAVYNDVPAEAVHLFDQIIDSICMTDRKMVSIVNPDSKPSP